MELEKLLLEVLPDTLGWKRRITNMEVRQHTADFVLTDDKACMQCESRGMSCDEKVVALYSVNNAEVKTYDIETYLTTYAKFYQKAKGCRCDYLHIDTSKKHFVLNELTCSAEKYVDPFENSKGLQDGKREKARKQMNTVIELMMEVEELKAYIHSYAQNIGLFSWKIPESKANDAERAMNLFMQPQQTVGNITILSSIDGGFKFMQQIYPSQFKF